MKTTSKEVIKEYCEGLDLNYKIEDFEELTRNELIKKYNLQSYLAGFENITDDEIDSLIFDYLSNELNVVIPLVENNHLIVLKEDKGIDKMKITAMTQDGFLKAMNESNISNDGLKAIYEFFQDLKKYEAVDHEFNKEYIELNFHEMTLKEAIEDYFFHSDDSIDDVVFSLQSDMHCIKVNENKIIVSEFIYN